MQVDSFFSQMIQYNTKNFKLENKSSIRNLRWLDELTESSERQNNDFIETIDNDTNEPVDDKLEIKNPVKSWDELKFIPNKKRFIILTIVMSLVEIGGFFIFAYAFYNSVGDGMHVLGLLLLPPLLGVLIAYFVQDKKEAVGISSINAVASIIPFMIIYSLIETLIFPERLFEVNIYFFLFPLLGLAFQVTAAYTISRTRTLYRLYGNPDIPRETDEAMIAELKQSRIERGLESPPIEEETDTIVKEKISEKIEQD